MAGSYSSHWLGDMLGALVGNADGFQLGTALGVQDGCSYSSHWLGEMLVALVGDADGFQLGTALGVQDGW